MTDYIERDNGSSSLIGVTVGIVIAIVALLCFVVFSGVWRPTTTVVQPAPVTTTAPAIEIPKQVDVNINQRQTP